MPKNWTNLKLCVIIKVNRTTKNSGLIDSIICEFSPPHVMRWVIGAGAEPLQKKAGEISWI